MNIEETTFISEQEMSKAKLMSQLETNESEYEYDELIEKAIEDEREGYILFLDLSKKMSNKKSKEAFELLAVEELEHLELLEKYLNDGPKSFKLPKTGNGFDEQLMNVSIDVDSDLKDVLAFAINEEKLAIKRYKRLAKMSKDEEVHDTFVQLSRFELSHLKRLENIYKANYSH